MKELIIDILKTHLPMVKPEILSQIADDILELKPAKPQDAVDCLRTHCANSTCGNCPYYAVFGCAFQMGKPPCAWINNRGADHE